MVIRHAFILELLEDRITTALAGQDCSDVFLKQTSPNMRRAWTYRRLRKAFAKLLFMGFSGLNAFGKAIANRRETTLWAAANESLAGTNEA